MAKILSKPKNLKNAKFGSLIYLLSIGAIKNFIFLTFITKKVFNYLKQVFIKVFILLDFNSKYYIQIKINVWSNIIRTILIQLNFN